MDQVKPNQNNNINTGPLKTLADQQGLPEKPISAYLEERPLFYNVMPHMKNSGTVSSPVVKVQGSVTSDLHEQIKSHGKNRLYALLGFAAVILILGVGGYFAYTKFYLESEGSDLLLEQAGNQPGGANISEQQRLKEWRLNYFGTDNCAETDFCFNEADPDRDGLKNIDEFKIGADPNNPDSDQDGLSDGDETYIFLTNPLEKFTAKNLNYNDADYFKGGYEISPEDKKLTQDQITETANRMKEHGLHQPTLTTLDSVLISFYKFNQQEPKAEPAAETGQPASSLPSDLDLSAEAKQDRDAQRSSTIKNIGIALVKYYQDRQELPKTINFVEMVEKVKIYIKVGVNPLDPVNKDPYVYTYEANADGNDFVLSFFSESQGLIIKKRMADSVKDKNTDEASLNDEQRKTHLKTIQTALLLYSNNNISDEQDYIFPAETKYKTDLVPSYISSGLPRDPKTAADYEYRVSENYNTFTLKTVLDNPPTGMTGYMCNQEECRYY